MSDNENLKKNSDTDSNGESEENIQIIEEYVEGYWICPKCNAKCKGSEQNCSSCGAVRGEDVEFFCDDEAPAIDDKEELEKAKAGPDWICQFCGNTSPSTSKRCTGCGSLRSDGTKRKEKDVPLQGKKPTTSRKTNQAPTSGQKFPTGAKIGCGIFALILMILMALSCQEKTAEIEILETSWQRTIEVEQFKRLQETAWRNEVPSAGKAISSRREIRSYNKIPDGYENVTETYTEKVKVGEKRVKAGKKDLGNGRFKIKYKMVPQYENQKKTRTVRKQKYRKEPVYDEKVTYEINRWKAQETKTASGKNDEPSWPPSEESNNKPAQVGDFRNGKKTEKYEVKAKILPDGKEFKIEEIDNKPLTYQQFKKLKKGSRWKAVFSGLGTLKKIEFEPEKK
jgi:ribosomal protein L40E